MDTASAFSFDMSYCGPPPLPADLWTRWTLDPVLLATLAAAFGLGLVALRGACAGVGRRGAFMTGMAVLAIAFVSPLCALTVALFSARVAHHLLIVAVAAPLLALAAGGGRMLPARLLTPLFLLHTAVFWLWHAPDPYVAALSHPVGYWLIQVSLLATAGLLWAAVFAAPHGPGLMALLGTTMQMGLLGALLVFAPAPLYWPHLATAQPFGLDPLADQQLAGLMMWVPASLPYLGVALWRLHAWLAAPAGAGGR